MPNTTETLDIPAELRDKYEHLKDRIENHIKTKKPDSKGRYCLDVDEAEPTVVFDRIRELFEGRGYTMDVKRHQGAHFLSYDLTFSPKEKK